MKNLEELATPFQEWVDQDKDHRVVVIMTYDTSDGGCTTSGYLHGSRDTLIPALAAQLVNKEDMFGRCMQAANNVVGVTALEKILGFRKEGKDE